MSKWTSLALFIIVITGIGFLIGITMSPEGWYAALQKPALTPPNWIFAPVWTTLYIIIAIVGWRTWQRDPQGTPMKLWVAQMVLNFIWTPVFFGLHHIDLALIIIVLTVIMVAAFIMMVRRSDGLSALMFVPYLAWISFATYLNGGIAYLN